MSLLLFQPTATIVPVGEISDWNPARVVFLGFAALVVLGALSTIVRKNDVAAVMSLVATFFGLAAVYTFLSAHFIAVLQVLVYAGAIMVLFIFVVMVLNRDETDPWVWRGLVGKALAGAGIGLYITFELCSYLSEVKAARPSAPPAEFGTVAQVGQLLFTDYLFAFEAISVLLLIAVIAAVVVARTAKHPAHASGPDAQPENRIDAHAHVAVGHESPAQGTSLA